MTDEELADAWAILAPTWRRRRHLDARVLAWLEARDTPLATEWLGLFRAAPLPALGFVTASALSVVAAPPLLWVARVLM